MAGHGTHIEPHNKEIALLVSILALVLAFSETFGKSSQTNALSANIEASNFWSFFQAITTIPALVWIAGALGVVGATFCVAGFFPTSVHPF